MAPPIVQELLDVMASDQITEQNAEGNNTSDACLRTGKPGPCTMSAGQTKCKTGSEFCQQPETDRPPFGSPGEASGNSETSHPEQGECK